MRTMFLSLALIGALTWSSTASAQHHGAGHSLGGHSGQYYGGHQSYGGYYGSHGYHGTGWNGVLSAGHSYAPTYGYSTPSYGYSYPSYGVGLYGAGFGGFSAGLGGHHPHH